MLYYTYMLSLSQMIMRLTVAIVLGAVMGWERELIGKEAGIRTSMLVSAGAAMFAMLGIDLPFLMIGAGLSEAGAGANGAMNLLANIVLGIGFIGGGIIFLERDHTRERVHGLTTAAVVWTTAALGALVGAGLVPFAVFATIFIAILLYILRRVTIPADRKHAPLYVPLPPKRRLARTKANAPKSLQNKAI